MTIGPKNSSCISRSRGSLVSITVGSTKKPLLSSVPPPAITSAWLPLAYSIASRWRAKDLPSITAPMKFEKSLTSPIVIVPTSSTSRSFSSGQRFEGA